MMEPIENASPIPSRRAGRRGPVRDRIEGLVRVRAGDLLANPANWRRHPERQRAALRGLLREIGYADALLARREGESLVLVDGHLRQSLDPDQMVPVLVLDVTEREADTLLATLDPLAALAEPDTSALASLLERVDTSNRAVGELLAELARSAGLPPRPVLTDPEDVPPLPEKPITRPGDLWILGEHRLLCGDATNPEDVRRLMDGEKADVLWTDPPYGVGYEGRTSRRLAIAGDSQAGLEELLRMAFTNASAVLAEGARIYVCHPAGRASLTFLQAFVDQGWRLHQTLAWVKDSLVLGHSDYHYQHEPIAYGYALGRGKWGRGGKGWYGGNSQPSVIEVPRPAASREHPTMKPVELIRRCLVNSSRTGDRILDIFSGSGSTLLASEITGRRGFSLELDPHYCDVAVHRFERTFGRQGSRGLSLK
jgi:DNA modification methylase